MGCEEMEGRTQPSANVATGVPYYVLRTLLIFITSLRGIFLLFNSNPPMRWLGDRGLMAERERKRGRERERERERERGGERERGQGQGRLLCFPVFERCLSNIFEVIAFTVLFRSVRSSVFVVVAAVVVLLSAFSSGNSPHSKGEDNRVRMDSLLYC